MAGSVNKVMLLGRLTKDPELRYTPKGTAVCDVSIALNRVYTDPSGEKKEEVTFVDVTCWQRTAEVCAQYLKKGREVFFEGRLQLDQWDTPEGQKRSRLKVVADQMTMIGGGGGGGGRGDAASEAPEGGSAPKRGNWQRGGSPSRPAQRPPSSQPPASQEPPQGDAPSFDDNPPPHMDGEAPF